ncbi:MAG: UDP-N-acetylglucosamine 2-epimerase (non-hydrolyzing) [Rickettsiales bacterium]|nr:UDP-N-acetylglucosamine 2-epimerase (non-hydrolyzing) [Rickettsiales bacterium]
MTNLRILSVFGTRPEVIKFAPVLNALRANPGVESIIGVTGQHREMLTQMLNLCELKPDFNLDVMRPNQTLSSLTATVLKEIEPALKKHKPDRVLVQGDTTTGFATTLACFYSGIRVGHIEAGLRSHNIYAPYPEEFNRKAISLLADMHFAPTEQSAGYLRDEKVVPEDIYMTGNTVVDALHYFSNLLDSNASMRAEMEQKFSMLDKRKKLILTTMHRRENFDLGVEVVCNSLIEIANREDAEIYFPVHLNPNIRGPVQELLADHPSIHLGDPLDYLNFIYLMNRAYFIISDSGGVQEEGPSLKKPVLVLRELTERPEGVTAGACKLVGTDSTKILHAATELLDSETSYRAMQQGENLYGDGHAATRIVEHILERHGVSTTGVSDVRASI